MPSSDLAYKALYAALEARSRTIPRTNPRTTATLGEAPQFHDDVFVETSGTSSTNVYMFIVRSTTTMRAEPVLHRYGVFANVDKRAASAPRIDPIVPDDASQFLQALPAVALVSDLGGDPASGGTTFEVRIRNQHLDVTMHFANPRPPRIDLIELGRAIRDLVAIQIS
jgi:hypothetical protein